MNNLQPSWTEFQGYRPGSDISETEFDALIADAEAWVDEYIYPNTVDTDSAADTVTAYKAAICAVCDFDAEYPAGAASSYTAGKVHETFSTDGQDAPSREASARMYLSGSGLLCRWL